MAESGLSIGWGDLKSEVGFFLNAGRSGWAAARETEIEGLVQSGIRLVYYPPKVVDPTGKIDTAGYEGSWIKPYTTITLSIPYATGTVAIASGVVTLTSGTFPSWAADGTIQISGSSYTVNTRDGDTQVTLDDTSVDEDAGTSYNLIRDTYTLPDDVGRVVGMFHFPLNEYKESIELVSHQQWLEMRASSDLTGDPRYAATRFKAEDRTTGHRQEAMFYPTPDTAWILHYQYEAYSGALSDSYPYPLGGMKLSELYIESCLSVAERRIHDQPGFHTQQFEALLLDAVARDMKNSARNFGYMGEVEEHDVVFRRGWTGGTYPISYKGGDV
jgi:hypothetical protein